MAVPFYQSTLTDVILDPQNTTGWVLVSSGGGGGQSLTVPETDDFFQGNNSISRNPWSSSTRGMMYLATNVNFATFSFFGVVYIWWKADAAQSLDIKSQGGVQFIVGNNNTNYYAWYIDGKDTYDIGGWKCTVISPSTTIYPPDELVGSPTTGGSNYVGIRWKIPATGPSRGFPFKIDAIRFATHTALPYSLFAQGGDSVNGYVNFNGLATYLNDSNLRTGQFQFRNGAYYFQTRLQIGGSSSSSTQFVDSNRTIFIENIENVSNEFNIITIGNSSGVNPQENIVVNWTNISITALGTTSRGIISILSQAPVPTVNFTSCTFTDIDTIILNSTSTVDKTTFRRTGQIVLNSGTISNCVIDSNRAAIGILAGNNLSTISAIDFISSGAGHALEISGGTTHTLNNLTFTGYPAGTAGTNVTTTSTGNEAVFVNVASGTVTLNISGGTIPSVRSSGAQVNVLQSALVTITGIQSGSEVRAYVGTDPATSVEIDGTETSGTTFTFSQSVAGQQGYITIIALGYNAVYLPITYGSLDVEIPVQQTVDRVYNNPPG